MPWSDESSASPECDREEHAACPMWSPPGDGPPRLCGCGCHRPQVPEPEGKRPKRPARATPPPDDTVPAVFEKLGIDVPPEVMARAASSASRPASAPPDRQTNPNRLRVIGGVEVAAGLVSLLNGATVMAVIFLGVGAVALYVASRQAGAARD